MGVKGWHILGDSDKLILSRHIPARFDVAVCTVLPRANMLRLAHQIRQDMWRAMQKVRGFSPVVEIRAFEEEVHVRAGGRVLGVVSPAAGPRIADILEDTANRARWLRFAREER